MAVIIGVIFSSNIFAQKSAVTAASNKVLRALKSKNTNLLAWYVHPKKGLTFSPYGFFQGDSLKFSKWQVAGLRKSRKVYEWGSFDGSGDPMKLSFASYYRRFVFNRDYTKAHTVSYNKILGRGNSLNDIDKFFPRANFVEYYFPKGKDGNEMGWNSLWLIFEKYGNRWYLIGIGHGQWTI